MSSGWSPATTLRGRLMAAGLVLAVFAVAITALSVERLTLSSVETSIERDLDIELYIRDRLAGHALTYGSWDRVENEVLALAGETGERIALADFDDVILADSELLLFGEAAPLPIQATTLDPGSQLFGLAPLGSSVEFDVAFPTYDQCAIDVDDNGLTVAVEAVSELDENIELDPLEANYWDLCDPVGTTIFLPSGEAVPVVSDELDVPALTGELSDSLLADEGEAIDLTEEQIDDIDVDQLAGLPPLQLFIGYGDDRDGGLSAAGSIEFWVATLAVLAAAGVGTVVLARRITSPVMALTDAARRMHTGDLSARVPVGGADEIAELGQAFNAMADSIEAEDRARRTLTTDVAHELRSPLANLRGYLEAVEDGVVHLDAPLVGSLQEEVTTLQVLVDDLQQLSLAEAGRITLTPISTDLGDLAERVVTAHQGSAHQAGVVLTAATAPGVVASVDPDRVRQIVTNLVGNAIRHTEPEGRVEVSVDRHDEHHVAVAVCDTGEGIAPEHIDHVFDRFYRADPSRSRATGGSGLGLAIARQLAEAHGGHFDVTSELGAGSTFRLVLPVDGPAGRHEGPSSG
ncbi:MAG: ATP-binding protein [Actinomycetota bacterium]